MFVGLSKYTIDAKGRLTIPVAYREALASGAYITQGYDRNLSIYTVENFQKMADAATKHSVTMSGARSFRRAVFGPAQRISLDSSGRVLIPSYLRDYALIDSDVVVVGAGEYFEIWQDALWEQESARLGDPETNADRYEDFDLSLG